MNGIDVRRGPDLTALFDPRSVAVIGASRTPGKMGYDVLRALVDSPFEGAIHPVNRDGGEILGLPAYSTVADVPMPPDLAIVVVPADAVVRAVREAAARGARVVQVLSAGFGELGDDGRAAEADLAAVARASGARVVGPNCVGTFSARSGLTWTSRASFEPGHVSVVSQSGGLAYDVLLGGARLGMRFDKVVSVGNCVDVQIADVVRFLGAEATTRVIGMYVEGVDDGRGLLDAIRVDAAGKPVVVLKGGRSSAGGASVGTHTGRLAGDYRIWQAALHQAGAIEVRSIESMVAVLAGLDARPGGLTAPGVALMGNGGGATVLAVDRCADVGLPLAELADAAVQHLRTTVAFEGAVPASGTPLDLPLARLLARGGGLFADVLATYAGDPAVGVVVPHLNLVPLGEWDDRDAVIDEWLDHVARVDVDDAVVLPVLRTDGGADLGTFRWRVGERLHRIFGTPVFDRVDDALECAAALAGVRGG